MYVKFFEIHLLIYFVSNILSNFCILYCIKNWIIYVWVEDKQVLLKLLHIWDQTWIWRKYKNIYNLFLVSIITPGSLVLVYSMFRFNNTVAFHYTFTSESILLEDKFMILLFLKMHQVWHISFNKEILCSKTEVLKTWLLF